MPFGDWKVCVTWALGEDFYPTPTRSESENQRAAWGCLQLMLPLGEVEPADISLWAGDEGGDAEGKG